MKIYFNLILTLFLSSYSFAEDIEKKTVLNGKLEILAPKNFKLMSKAMLEIKYPNSRRPTEVLCNSSGSVSLAFNFTNNKLLKKDIKAAHIQFSKLFHNLYPSAKWLRDEIAVKGGNKFIILEMITPAVDTKIHNIMYVASVDDKMLFVSFNFIIEETKKWLPIGQKIIQSINVIKK